MNSQLQMFGPPPLDPAKARAIRRAGVQRDIEDGLICDTPAARTTDPEPSHEAADEISATGMKAAHQRRILEAVQKMPGLTVIELATQVGLTHVAVGKRMSELVTAVRVRKGDPRRVGNRRYTTWYPT